MTEGERVIFGYDFSLVCHRFERAVHCLKNSVFNKEEIS
jgi:hypothetical protein